MNNKGMVMEMKYKLLDTPFLPKKDVALVIIDARASKKGIDKLHSMGIDIVQTPCCNDVYNAISYHPDILLHPIDGENIVVAPNVYEKMRKSLCKTGLNVIKGRTALKRNYPENVAYNIARVSKFAIHNLKYTDQKVVELLEKKGVEFINVKQGYSKCSICIVNEKAIITSDRGIAKTVSKYGIEALIISAGYINLFELNYGFIGGISGLIGKNKLAFSGCLKHHPDYKDIRKFLEYHKVNPIFLEDEKPTDIGSIIPILEMEL